MVWDVVLGLTVALTLFEDIATTRFGFYDFGIPVWRDRWHEYPAIVPASRAFASDTYWAVSSDRLLFQRQDDALYLPGLQYKGTLRRADQGAVATVRAPLFPVVLCVAAAVGLNTWWLLIGPVAMLPYARYRGSKAAVRLRDAGHA